MVYKFFDKKTSGSGIKNENISNKELVEKLHKPIIRKFNKRKVQSFIDKIWDAYLVDMQIISKFNTWYRFLLCAIDIYINYASAITLKDKKFTTITNAFQKILKESNCKQSKVWGDKDSEFYNRSVKSWLEKNDIEMYLTKAERFSRTLRNNIYKYMTSISKKYVC